MKKIFLLLALSLVAGSSICATPKITQADKDKAAELLSKMTLEEKCRLVSGQYDKFHTYAIERLGIKSTALADATMGVRNVGNLDTLGTRYPSGIALAASFNREAASKAGYSVAQDCKSKGIGILLGPGVNIYRYACCGRNFEYMGEDPYLAGELAASYIQGMQDNGIIATVKHFALNNQEYDRHMTESRADERTINEIYFPAFKKAVQKGGVAAVMSSYNPVNGAHASDNQWLLGTLRQWGFEGILMSDWTSTYTTIGCMESELDMEFPGNHCFTPKRIIPLVENGVVTEAQLDRKCLHILQTLSAFGMIDKSVLDKNIPVDNPESRAAALKVAEESIVLVKNNGILPLKPGKKDLIVLTGDKATESVFGGGSSRVHVFPGRESTAYSALTKLKNYNVVYDVNPSEELMQKAKAIILCTGFDQVSEKEGSDRKYDYFSSSRRARLNKFVPYAEKVVLVLNTGGEIDIKPFGNLAAILCAWFPGQDGGTALAEVLTGKISPSGRLPFTWWGSLKKNPVHGNYYKTVISPREEAPRYALAEYREGIFLGYRGIDKFKTTPLYPFGHGLTYSEFKYSDLSVKPTDKGTEVSFKLTNTGKMDAAEVAQVYVAPVNPSMPRPTRELKEFAKVKLAKGASQTVTVVLTDDAFAHYDQNVHKWVVDAGKYKIQIGASATDIKLEAELSK